MVGRDGYGLTYNRAFARSLGRIRTELFAVLKDVEYVVYTAQYADVDHGR